MNHQPTKRLKLDEGSKENSNVSSFFEITFMGIERVNIGKYRPEFTHQLFDDEDFYEYYNSEVKEVSEELITRISIDLRDLSQHVYLPASQLMSVDNFMMSLQKGLPLNACTISPTWPKFPSVITPLNLLDSLSFGKTLREIHRNEETFEISLVSYRDAGIEELLKRWEKIAMWLIETADSVDFHDDRWEMILLTKIDKKATNARILLGYFTIFNFRNPFSGSKMRICQALIVPPYQGKGLGKDMMIEVYRLAESREDVSEVSVVSSRHQIIPTFEVIFVHTYIGRSGSKFQEFTRYL